LRPSSLLQWRYFVLCSRVFEAELKLLLKKSADKTTVLETIQKPSLAATRHVLPPGERLYKFYSVRLTNEQRSPSRNASTIASGGGDLKAKYVVNDLPLVFPGLELLVVFQ